MNEIEKMAKTANDSAGIGCIIMLAIPVVVIVLALLATILL